MNRICSRRRIFVCLLTAVLLFILNVWNFSRISNENHMKMVSSILYNWSSLSVDVIRSEIVHKSEVEEKLNFTSSHLYLKAEPGSLSQEVNIPVLIDKVKDNLDCMKVAGDPISFWRSQSHNGSLNTSNLDIARMDTAYSCGMLYKEFFSTPPTSKIYPFEQFYLSEPPLTNINDTADENLSIVTQCNSSSKFKVGETVAFMIEMRDRNGKVRIKGGDQLRVWFEDQANNTQMAAKVTDLKNGSYLASAPLPWPGKLRLYVALAYPREYLRAVLHVHQVLKSFRPIAAVFSNSLASEATPCYHTHVVPGYKPSELCDLTKLNGAPWFCGHPIKRQLGCSDFKGTAVISETKKYPLTDAEMEVLKRSCREPRIRNIPTKFELTVSQGQSTITPTLPCHKVSSEDTWSQEIPTGYLSKRQWYPMFCQIPKQDYSKCFINKQILLLGDSNGRSHYENIKRTSNCKDIKKALTKKWHKPLLCVHTGNNFTLRWDPHTNPFMNGRELATVDSLIPSAGVIDGIPSHGHYLIILNHYFHLTTYHISSIDMMFRYIKDALVRLFQRNPNAQVVLQAPHISWFGWVEHYAAGDMFGTNIMDLQREIFHDIKDKVVFISPWDMSIAVKNWDFHPSINNNIYDAIVGFMCGR